MDYLLLDQVFPFVVFGSGLILLVFFEFPLFRKLAEEHLSGEMLNYWRRQQVMAWCFFWVGGLWSLQRALSTLALL
jgi:hypothetical protein